VNDTPNYVLIRARPTGGDHLQYLRHSDGRKVTYTTSDFYNIVTRGSVTTKDPTLGTGTTRVNHGARTASSAGHAHDHLARR